MAWDAYVPPANTPILNSVYIAAPVAAYDSCARVGWFCLDEEHIPVGWRGIGWRRLEKQRVYIDVDPSSTE